jgi:hypothetical protein
MPIYKFRSVEDMPGPAWRTPGDPALYRALFNLSETTRRLHPRRFPAGVYKHRSIEEMNAQRDRWDREHVARTRNGPEIE